MYIIYMIAIILNKCACMGCARGLGLGEQHVQDKSSQKFCYINLISSGVARILVREDSI